jgi:hypothetical protein
MKRIYAFRSGVITSAIVLVCGTWAFVHAQTKTAGRRSSDATIESSNHPAGATTTQARSGNKDMGNGMAQMMRMRSMMGAMASPADDDPEMAKLAVAEAELADSSEALLSQYAAADKPDEQKRLKAEIRDALEKQFDVQHERRELELARVEDRIKKVREQLKKRNEARQTIVDRRLDQLINDVDGLGWTAPAGASPRGAGSDLYRNDFQNRPAATPALRQN